MDDTETMPIMDKQCDIKLIHMDGSFFVCFILLSFAKFPTKTSIILWFFLLLLFLLLLLDKVSEIYLALVNEFYVQTKKSNTITYLT